MVFQKRSKQLIVLLLLTMTARLRAQSTKPIGCSLITAEVIQELTKLDSPILPSEDNECLFKFHYLTPAGQPVATLSVAAKDNRSYRVDQAFTPQVLHSLEPYGECDPPFTFQGLPTVWCHDKHQHSYDLFVIDKLDLHSVGFRDWPDSTREIATEIADIAFFHKIPPKLTAEGGKRWLAHSHSLKPGLWDMSETSSGSGIYSVLNGETRYSSCIRDGGYALQKLLPQTREDDCLTARDQVSSIQEKIDVECNQKGSDSYEITYNDSGHYAMKGIQFLEGAYDAKRTMQLEAHWAGADCGVFAALDKPVILK